MNKNLMDLNPGEKFTMDDFPNMVLVAWVIQTEKGWTRVTYKVDRPGKQRFDQFYRPALTTVYPA